MAILTIDREREMSGDSTVSREALHAAFGRNAFELGCFYANAPALRFELSLGGTSLDQFEQAWDRAREVVDHAFGDADELVAVVTRFTPGPPIRHVEMFRSLRALRVPVRRPFAWWDEPYHDSHEPDGPDTQFYMAFRVQREAVHRLLWGPLAVDLCIRPALSGWLYLADPARGIVVHPYDDRGMDIVGPNRALLAELYHRFNAYLLDYDRDRMDAYFAPGADGEARAG